MRRFSLVTAIALILSACGGTGTDSADSSSTTDAVSSTAAPATSQSTAPGSSDAPNDPAPTPPEAASFDGPSAPDFELALSDGETFTLSGEQKPVYLVFWAEW